MAKNRKKKIKNFQVSPINLGKKNKKKNEKQIKKIKTETEKKKSEKEETNFKKIKIEKLAEKNLEGEIEESDEEVNDENFTGFLQPLTPRRTSPVLERVASTREIALEEQLAAVKGENEERTINYNETKSDYLTTNPERNPRTTNYMERSPNYSELIQQEKAGKETRRILEQTGEKPMEQNQRNRWEMMEKARFLEENEETKKYISKGDYKP